MDLATANPPAESQAALVAAILAGQPQAFERLMRQHNRRLFRVARSIVGNDGAAEDVVQEGYVQAYRALPGFRGEARLSTWLTRIIVNLALSHRRRFDPLDDSSPLETGEAERLAAPEPARRADSPEAVLLRSELRQLIEQAIDALPAPYRSVFVLRAIEEMSVEETASVLGISPGNTKVRFLRARQQLRSALGQQLGVLLDELFSFDGARCDRIVSRVAIRLGLPCPAPSVGRD